MSKHSLLPSHATPGAVFAVDTVRLRNGYLTSDVVGLAIRYWRSFPSYLVVCNSLPEDQKDLARSRLDSAYDAATWVLMREAYKIGLDPYALQECGRLVKRLYREDPKRAYYSQKDCYYWPDCIDERQDEWPSELPESEQAVLRNGEAVFTRLVLHWEIAKAAPPTPPSPGHNQGEGEGGKAGWESDQERLNELSECYRQAWITYTYAEAKTEKRLTDSEAYNWLKENGIEDAVAKELGDYELPCFETWSRYVREARNTLGEQKYSRRAGRPHGGSIALRRDIDPPPSDDD